MNIRWNPTENRFEAEFSQDFQGDLEAVKEAKFHTTGPPNWVWYAPAPGIPALNRLRAKRPVSGLTITDEAWGVYAPLAETEEKNAAVRKQLADAKKGAKKQRKAVEQESAAYIIPEGKIWLGPEDIPAKPSLASPYVPTTPIPDLRCRFCSQPVYFYELQDPPTCLWCEIHETQLPTNR
jgi:hypothetical protein